MILNPGSKLLIVHRRLFENDSPRFFIGTVDTCTDQLVKATGYSWIRDELSGNMIKKVTQTTRLFPLGAGSLLVYELLESLNLDSIRFEFDHDGKFWLIGEPNYKIDLSETEHTRRHSRVSSIGQP